jgi:DNA topoisomerase-1
MACSGFPNCRYTQALDEEGEPTPVEKLDEKCPQCGGPLVVRTGRRGKFIGCSAYPKCRYTRNIEASQAPPAEGGAAPPQATARERRPAEPTGEKCPKCGKPLLAREGKRGKFLGCSGYPRCRYTRDAAGGEAPPIEGAEAKCEKCGAPMVRRRWRGRAFLACSAYPKCKNMKPDKSAPPPPPPKEVGRNCPECQKPLVIRTSRRGPFIGCSGYPKCRYTENA